MLNCVVTQKNQCISSLNQYTPHDYCHELCIYAEPELSSKKNIQVARTSFTTSNQILISPVDCSNR
jgi:hypothetical protein